MPASPWWFRRVCLGRTVDLVTRIRTWWARMTPEARVAVVLVTVLLPLAVLGSEDPPEEGDVSRGLDAVSLGLLAVAVLAMLASRRFPGSAVVVSMVAVSTWYDLGHTSGLITPAVLVVFYQLGYTGDRRRQFGLGLPAISLPLLSNLFSGDSIWDKITSGDWPIDAVGWPIAAMLLGELVRNRRLLLDEYADRARTAENERDAEADRRVAQERLRIARDLHDVLAHTVSVMNVQAGAATDTIDRDLEAARASLQTIRAAGKQAMTEVRATISVLRDTEASTAVETHPAPGIDQIPELVEGVRTQGLSVDLELGLGPDRTQQNGSQGLDSLVELTAYRVVQEGLTNVTRHAHASHVEVRLHQHGSDLIVEISDDGTASPTGEALGGGFGMKGMRERIEPLGGTLSYGPRPGGGWSVLATLPTRKAHTS